MSLEKYFNKKKRLKKIKKNYPNKLKIQILLKANNKNLKSNF